MEKRKVFKISIIDKEISRTEFDRNTFYTSDSELSLVFKLIEKDYSYDHGEILLYNENDKSFVTRPIKKQENDFVYELDLDIIPHYGKWRAQLQLIKDGDVYTSKPFEFVIENDLSNLAPQPTLTDINNWATLKQSANELIDEMRDIIVDVERSESERASKENKRQQAELNRVNNELTRENQENERKKAESKRENNEKQRRIAEFERIENENTRQNSESQRQLTFETDESERQTTFEFNETERQTTFEAAESERQSAELTRVENENQRNLTSVEEFVKLQNAVGGRNYLLKSGEPTPLTMSSNSPSTLPLTKGVENGVDWVSQHSNTTNKFIISTFISENLSSNNYGVKFSKDLEGYNGDLELSVDVMSTQSVTIRMGNGGKIKLTPDSWYRLETYSTRPLGLYADSADNENVPVGTKVYWKNYKIGKGTQATPYTKATEDYTVVSKDDYYDHIKMMNDFKYNQFNQLKQAVIALGGTI